MYTVLVNPQASYLDFLGNLVKNIANKTTNYLTKKSNGIVVDKNTHRTYLGDYTNRPIKEVAEELKAQGLQVTTLGQGNVIKQFPEPNQVISNNQQIILRGDGQVEPQTLIGKTVGEARGVCDIMDWDCQFNGTGNVSAVVDNGQGIYNIECGLPPRVQEEIDKRRTQQTS